MVRSGSFRSCSSGVPSPGVEGADRRTIPGPWRRAAGYGSGDDAISLKLIDLGVGEPEEPAEDRVVVLSHERPEAPYGQRLGAKAHWRPREALHPESRMLHVDQKATRQQVRVRGQIPAGGDNSGWDAGCLARLHDVAGRPAPRPRGDPVVEFGPVRHPGRGCCESIIVGQ
jgi:hypothetical protein